LGREIGDPGKSTRSQRSNQGFTFRRQSVTLGFDSSVGNGMGWDVRCAHVQGSIRFHKGPGEREQAFGRLLGHPPSGKAHSSTSFPSLVAEFRLCAQSSLTLADPTGPRDRKAARRGGRQGGGGVGAGEARVKREAFGGAQIPPTALCCKTLGLWRRVAGRRTQDAGRSARHRTGIRIMSLIQLDSQWGGVEDQNPPYYHSFSSFGICSQHKLRYFPSSTQSS
jgi:hypothetical protein